MKLDRQLQFQKEVIRSEYIKEEEVDRATRKIIAQASKDRRAALIKKSRSGLSIN